VQSTCSKLAARCHLAHSHALSYHVCIVAVLIAGAGYVEAGEDNIILAVHGLGKDIRSAGFTLTCQTFPIGPGVKVALNKYDEVYYEQV
jgi:hypothetical protein